MRILLLMVLSLTVVPAYAFEPQKHVEFSNDAMALYKICTNKFVAGKNIKAFAAGAEAEDNPTPSRGLNWHFYSNSGKIGCYWWGPFCCNGSNVEIFKFRVDTLKERIAAKDPIIEDIYFTIGRIAHHIQDMSSPPHVLPIYHTSNDLFDKYEPATVENLATPEVCDEIRAVVYTPAELLEKAAQATLIAAAAPVEFAGGEKNSGESWKKFWGGGASTKYQGFSTYGVYGNTFGVKASDPENAMRGKYTPATFDNFFNLRRNRAVIDTAKLLIYVETLKPEKEFPQ